jgi:uncharacterized protein
MSQTKQGNPAVVGLAGFGLTTLVLQFVNVGWAGPGPVLALALIFGGLTQLVAGFQEMKTGNNFGYCAFTGYGAFWIAFALILLGKRFDIYKSSDTDIAWFLVAFTLFTAILWIGSLRVSKALAVTFTLLLIGFILLVIGHFFDPFINKIAGYELMLCAFSAWYIMAHIVYLDVAGRDILPVGEPWVK